MANVRNANTFFIDTASGSGGDTLAIKNIKVSHILITGANAGSPNAILQDVTTTATKIDIKVLVGESLPLDFSDNPLVFPNGIDPVTIVDCTVTCVIQESRG